MTITVWYILAVFIIIGLLYLGCLLYTIWKPVIKTNDVMQDFKDNHTLKK